MTLRHDLRGRIGRQPRRTVDPIFANLGDAAAERGEDQRADDEADAARSKDGRAIQVHSLDGGYEGDRFQASAATALPVAMPMALAKPCAVDDSELLFAGGQAALACGRKGAAGVGPD